MPGKDLLSLRWPQSVQYYLTDMLILTALRKQGKTLLHSQKQMPDGGIPQPHVSTRATLPYRRSDWKGLALCLKTEFKRAAIAGLDFWLVPWQGGKSGFLPPQAGLAIV